MEVKDAISYVAGQEERGLCPVIIMCLRARKTAPEKSDGRRTTLTDPQLFFLGHSGKE